MERIAVIGTTGSGKSTLARALAERLGLFRLELDAIMWGPNWTASTDEAIREGVLAQLPETRWVSDGNYSMVRDIIWSRADTLVWLDYAYPVILRRLFRRTLRRVQGKEVLWNGNKERFATQFLSRESLFLWQLQTHWKHRERYPQAFPQYPQLQVLHFTQPRQTDQWLHALKPVPQPTQDTRPDLKEPER